MLELTQERITYYISQDPRQLELSFLDEMRTCMKNYISYSCETKEYRALQEELIRANSMPGTADGEMVSIKGYKDPDRLLQTLEKVERQTEEYKVAVYMTVEKAAEKLESFRRFQTIYNKLPREWRNILEDLHKHNEKWDYVAQKYGCSKSALGRKRIEIIENIIKLYNSPLGIAALAKTDFQIVEHRRISNSRTMEGQLTFEFVSAVHDEF